VIVDKPAARLRAMVPADLADVLDLERALFPDDPWTPEMFTEEIIQPREIRMYLVASDDEHPLAGYAGMMFVPGGIQADVLTIAVRQDTWAHGVGSLLLGALIDEARARDCLEVFLEVREDNDRARGLYLRRGFEEMGIRRGYYQPSGVNAVVMRKDLKK
jgi:[ribosomal protein S18]-alanine N-acetyltransferase